VAKYRIFNVPEFDGKDTTPLHAAIPRASKDPQLLVESCSYGDSEVAASWVLKALVEQEGVERFDMETAFAALHTKAEWQTNLHLLQLVKYAPEAATKYVAIVRDLMSADKVLVRVWALDAFVRIAGVAPEFRQQAAGAVEGALGKTPASLRARARVLKVICALW
jgi:hypothetical protein